MKMLPLLRHAVALGEFWLVTWDSIRLVLIV